MSHTGTDADRTRVLSALALLASDEAQLKYQQRVPLAHVSAELLCLWDEAFWANDSQLRGAFSEPEWEALLRFNSVFDRVTSILPADLAPIHEFQRSQHWLRLSRAAARALAEMAPN